MLAEEVKEKEEQAATEKPIEENVEMAADREEGNQRQQPAAEEESKAPQQTEAVSNVVAENSTVGEQKSSNAALKDGQAEVDAVPKEAASDLAAAK